jgi:antitoxin ParD1/3/4
MNLKGVAMNISLTPQLEELVQEKVASSLYNSASEVIREALRLLEAQDQFHQMKLKALRDDIAVGLVQADRGELKPAKEVFARLRRRSQKLKRQKK